MSHNASGVEFSVSLQMIPNGLEKGKYDFNDIKRSRYLRVRKNFDASKLVIT